MRQASSAAMKMAAAAGPLADARGSETRPCAGHFRERHEVSAATRGLFSVASACGNSSPVPELNDRRLLPRAGKAGGSEDVAAQLRVNVSAAKLTTLCSSM